jgi:tRNA A37 threonylcarbamoyladenosine biosynthesis protein TsaE
VSWIANCDYAVCENYFARRLYLTHLDEYRLIKCIEIVNWNCRKLFYVGAAVVQGVENITKVYVNPPFAEAVFFRMGYV